MMPSSSSVKSRVSGSSVGTSGPTDSSGQGSTRSLPGLRVAHLPSWLASSGSEEPEAPELFDQVLEELGLIFHPPADPQAAKWAMASWIAGQIAEGTLDPATGTHLIWAEIAYDLGYPEELHSLVSCRFNLDEWEESWGVSLKELNREAIEAAKQFLSKRSCRFSRFVS